MLSRHYKNVYSPCPDLICNDQILYKLKKCSKKEFCKQCRYVKFKDTMTKWPVQKPTHRTTQKHIQHASDI